MRVGIFGRGRLGAAVAQAAREAGHELAWTLGRGEAPPAGAGSRVEVAVDASAAGAVAAHLSWALATGTDLLIGATGWDEGLLAEARAAGPTLPSAVMVAPNFSLGVAFLRRVALVLGRFAALDAEADLAILERHHRAKKDAPSGTAKLLSRALAEGDPAYAAAGVPTASLRLGAEVGYHEIRLETNHEALTFSHEAKDRGLFGQGALAAAAWLHGRNGVFTFDDFAADLIEPLFAPPGGYHA